MGHTVRAVVPLPLQPVMARAVRVGAAAKPTVTPVRAALMPPSVVMAVIVQVAAAATVPMVHTMLLPAFTVYALQDTLVPLMLTVAVVPYMLAPVTVKKPPVAIGQLLNAV